MTWDPGPVYLVLSAIGLGFTVSALVQARRLYGLVAPYFMGAWLTGELAPFHIVWQVVATALFALGGAFESEAGRWGLLLSGVSWGGLLVAWRRSWRADEAFDTALGEAFGAGWASRIPAGRRANLRNGIPTRVWLRPFSMKRPGVDVVRNIAYGPAGERNRLDVFMPREPHEDCPVILHVHGGAWVIGNKEQQGQPLLYHLASRGWVGVSINYRLSPRAKFPDHLVDCKRALAWIRENIAQFGGDPDFVAVTGGSAGGHLSSLVALTAGDPELQPGFEGADTSVSACVPFYGIYDFLDRENVRGSMSMQSMLERFVMPRTADEDPKLWDKASPVAQVHPDAPPFFVIHGTHDSLAFVEDARQFVLVLRSVSRSEVAYAEVPGAQHAFDVFHSVRSAHAVNAVTRFLELTYAQRFNKEEAA